MEKKLIEIAILIGDGAPSGDDTPAENIQQVDNRYGVETLVDDDRFGRVVWRFDLDDRFVEAAANFGRIGERVRVAFSEISPSKVTLVFEPQKIVAQEFINSPAQINVMNCFIDLCR